MKKLFIHVLIFSFSLTLGNTLFAQAPNLGTAANFVLFTGVGAITNTNISQIKGQVGSNSGASTGFGNVNGSMHNSDGTTAQCSTDLIGAYNQLNAAIPNYFHSPLLGNGDTLISGVYQITSATLLNGHLVLDGQGNPNAIFIFQIQAAFSSNALSKVDLINGALACNVFWKVEGLVDLASETYMRGNIIANNAGINMHALDTLEGRALSTSGAISINGTKAYTPTGYGSSVLSGPYLPSLGSVADYALFTSNGAMANSGITTVHGDVGTNLGLTTGFNPFFVNGFIHPIPDGSTASAAADLLIASNLLHAMTYDIELLHPAQFGNDLILTPHTYLMNAATSLIGNIYLNAEGNCDATFLIKIYGALTTSLLSHVVLMNGTQADHVYWLVSGAVNINSSTIFAGNIICRNGAISLTSGVQLNGRALTTNGSFSTESLTAAITPVVTAGIINTSGTSVISCTNTSINVLATGGTSYTWSGGSTANTATNSFSSPGIYTLTSTVGSGCSSTASIAITGTPCATTLNLKFLIQGYYLGSGLMTPTIQNEDLDPIVVPNFTSTDCDSVTISLREDNGATLATYLVVGIYKGLLHTGGTITCTFPSSTLAKSCYVVIEQRNSIQTWSSLPITIATVNSYDFTTSASKALGNNQIDVIGDGIYSIYNGDFNFDLTIDASDYLILDADIQSFNSGYIVTDLNGDGATDSSDFLILDGNIQSFVSAVILP